MDLGEIGQLHLDKPIENTGEKEKDISDTEKLLEGKIPAEDVIEEKEYLLGPYLGQYVIYTGPIYAWLF